MQVKGKGYIVMTHWKKLTNPNYLGAYSIEAGQELILTIGTVAEESVTGADGKKEDCVVCHFTERGVKPMILNSTNMKMISKLLGTPYIEQWSGKRIAIGVEKVKAFGEIVEALRVKPQLPAAAGAPVIKCEMCSGAISAAYGMTAEQLSQYTMKGYGKKLCAACAAGLKAQKAQAAGTDEANEKAEASEGDEK